MGKSIGWDMLRLCLLFSYELSDIFRCVDITLYYIEGSLIRERNNVSKKLIKFYNHNFQ